MTGKNMPLKVTRQREMAETLPELLPEDNEPDGEPDRQQLLRPVI
jgi:hypothetical protein